MTTSNPAPRPTSEQWFATTHWSVVLSARDQATSQSDEALEALCRTYWYPLYAFVRRAGHSPADAEDLTQEFFERLLHRDYLHSVAPEKGKFRTFLLVLLKRFLLGEWERSQAQKRGGGKTHFSLDTQLAENRYQIEKDDALSPDKVYDRRWALTLLEQAMVRLRQEFVAAGKVEQFEILKPVLTSDKGSIDYAEMAKALGLAEGAARVAVHRLRKRFRELFREQIAHTVASPDDIEDELHYLISLFGR